MAKKLFIQSQVPFVEVQVKSEKDVEGKQQTILVGFKRYTLDKAKEILEGFDKLSDEEAQAKISSDILYIKNAEVKEVDDETFEVSNTIFVKDSRSAKPIEPYWGSPEECLSVLVDMYFGSLPWKGSLITAYVKTLYNIDYKEAELKNS